MTKRLLPEMTDADLAEGQDEQLDQQQERQQPDDPVVRQRLEIYERAARIRDGEDPDEEPESAHDANDEEDGGDEGGDAPEKPEPERKTASDDGQRTVPLMVDGVVKMVPIDEVQRIAQLALARPAAEEKVEKAEEAAKPDAPEIDLDRLSEQLVLGDEAERREALQQLRDGIRAQIIAELKPGNPAPTRDEIEQLVANRLEQREFAAREQRALNEDVEATKKAYPALQTDENFMLLTQRRAFRERAEDLKAYAKKTGERNLTVAQVEQTLREAEAGNPEAIRLIAHNHRFLQLQGEKEGKALVRSRLEVFKAAAAAVARSNPNWLKGSEADTTRSQGFDAAIERKKKLVAQPAAAHRKPYMRPPSRQTQQQDQNLSPEASAKRYVEILQQRRGGYVN